MIRKSEVISIHPCDDRNQVVTVVRHDRIHRAAPCTECPWRLDSPLRRFPVEAYRHSACTCYDMAQSTFACHMHGRDKPTTCAGFLLCGSAIHNLAVRLAFANGTLNLQAIDASIPTYSSYREMAIANGVSPDDPALTPCRDE